MVKLKSVKALPDYQLHLIYTDGTEKKYDASWATKHLSDFFDQLLDPKYFQQVAVEGPGVVWPNGQSIGPRSLREGSIAIIENPAASNDSMSTRYAV